MKTPETRRVPGASFFQISQSNRRCISGSSFRSTFDSRLRSIFRPCPRTQPPACTGCCIVSAHPFTRPSTCVACRPSGPASRINLRLSSAVVCLRFNLPIDLWLAPLPDRPACPFELNLRLAPAVASSSSSFHPAFDLRRLPAFRPRFPNSTSDSHRSSHLRLILPVDLWLAPPIDPLAPPSNSPSGSHRLPRLRLRFPIDL